MMWVYLIACFTIFLFIGHQVVATELDRAKLEHAIWIARCLDWTRIGCDAEARFAAEQVAILRQRIDFLVAALRPGEWLMRASRLKR